MYAVVQQVAFGRESVLGPKHFEMDQHATPPAESAYLFLSACPLRQAAGSVFSQLTTYNFTARIIGPAGNRCIRSDCRAAR